MQARFVCCVLGHADYVLIACWLQESDEERGRRIASQWTNDPAAAGTSVREEQQIQPQQAHQQQLHAQPQHAQPSTHTTVTAAHTNTDSTTRPDDGSSTSTSNGATGHNQKGLGGGEISSSSTAALANEQSSDGRFEDRVRQRAATAAGVVVAQRAYVVVWAVLLVGCAALGGRRLFARAQR